MLASTTPRGLPKLPSESVNTRSTVTSMAMGRCYDVRGWRGGQVALRSSAPIASSTATRVSIVPVMALSLMPVRSRLRSIVLVVDGGLGGVDELLDDLDEAVGVVVEGEVAGALEDLQL